MITELFTIPIKTIDLNHLDLKSIENFCFNYKKQNESISIKKSNLGGYHSDILKLQNEKVLHPLADEIIKNAKIFSKELDIEETNFIKEMWFIINDYGQSNELHNHPNCQLSGVFYPLSNYDDMGELKFENGYHDVMSYDWNEIQKKYTTYNSATYLVPPKPGHLVLFPSFLKHSVNTNKTNKKRLSMSFNITRI